MLSLFSIILHMLLPMIFPYHNQMIAVTQSVRTFNHTQCQGELNKVFNGFNLHLLYSFT